MNETAGQSKRALVLGIDTGGTYTDGILLDYHTRTVLATEKSLTTKRDFAIGIQHVIDGIAILDPRLVQMVSISTTLATNAIAEGKGKRVALFLIGYDQELVASFRLDSQFATPNYYYFEGGHDLYGREKQALDLAGITARAKEIQNDVDALAVSAYFSPLNPEHELLAFEAISNACALPVVLGHQLSTKLGSIERATTAALNASLIAGLQEFVIAVRRALASRKIDAPLMVVRGDGTLMSDEYAAITPVETIHSGPAASAIGARFLSKVDDALVIDIGGTTTDIALLQNGQVAVTESGATVDQYKTAVRAAELLSIALGGDSHISLGRDRELVLGPERVTPLAQLACEDESVLPRLRSLQRRLWERATPLWLDYWFLLRPSQGIRSRLTAQQRSLVELLEPGPLPVPEILERLKVLHVSQVGAGDLFRREIVGKAGLTPTDLLHVDGRFNRWSDEAAHLGLTVFAGLQLKDARDVQAEVWRHMTETIARAIVTFLSRRQFNGTSNARAKDLAWWFFDNSLYATHRHLETTFRLRIPMIGIGAPAHILLHDLADSFHTELILPEHHEVANAVGAVAGSVMAAAEVLVYPHLSSEGLEVLGYYLQAGAERQHREELTSALDTARRLAEERALAIAHRAGAENVKVIVNTLSDGLDTFRVQAQALGNPRLGSPDPDAKGAMTA